MKSLSSVLALIVIFVSSAFAAQSDRITSAIDARTVEIPNHVRMQAQPKYDQGAVEPGFRMNHMMLLTTPTRAQQAAIDKLIADQQNPKSPMFHHWLTPEQIADRFGLSPADIARLTQWLKGQGFKVDRVARGRNFIVFSGTAAQVRSAFATEIHHFNVEGEEHFANATNPHVPAALAGTVAGIRGLDNFLMKPSHHIVRDPQGNQAQASQPGRWNRNYYDSAFNSQFLAPGDISTIYDIKALYTAGFTGAGQGIAVMGQSDVYLADLQDFRSGFGLPAITGCTTDATTLIITACSGGNFNYVLLDQDNLTPSPGNLSESDLDLEWTNAVAPQATITFVNAPVNGVTEAFYYAIDNAIAPVISLSYGACELDEGAFFGTDNTELSHANAAGITFLASTGDQGAAGCDYNNNSANFLAQRGIAVSFPASSQYVTGVGGTGVALTGFGSNYWGTTNAIDGGSALGYVPEQAWNDDAEFGVYCTNNPTANVCVNNNIFDQASAQAAIGISAAGGGVSNCTSQTGGGACNGGIAQPSWQSSLSLSGQAAGRFVPDISGIASPNFPGYIVCVPQSELPGGSASTSSCVNGIQASVEGTETAGINSSLIGGTSASTPVYAGVVALLGEYLGGVGLGNINPNLYGFAATSPTAFHPITTGDNTVYCSAGTPINQPASVQCPSSGILGFQASNFDATTKYNLAAGLGSLDVNNLAMAWSGSRTSTTIALGTSSNSIYQSQSVTLTATVTSTTAATGSVTFYNGVAVIGTQSVSGGTATLTTTTLPVGSDSVTAQYNGDGSNGASPHSAAQVITVAAAFTLAASDVSTTQGGTAGPVTITPTPATGPPPFTANLTYSCSTTASEATCTASPNTAVSPSTPITVSITTTAPQASLQFPGKSRGVFYALLLPGLFGLVMAGKGNRKGRTLMMLGFMAVLASSTMWMSACSSSSSTKNPGTPKGMYPVTVSATTGGANAITNTVMFTMTVN